MNYKNIQTSEKMNEVVKEQLIFRDDHLSKYAAKRIEELEQLLIQRVSQQRELLYACCDKLAEAIHKHPLPPSLKSAIINDLLELNGKFKNHGL